MRQDASLVASNQPGVNSRSYVPGQYALTGIC